MNFIPIFEEYVRDGHWDLERLIDHKGTMVLVLLNNHGQRIRLSFDSYLAYRKLDEGDALLTLADMQMTGGTGRYFYRVENSAFLAWFNQERCDEKSKQALVHYSVAAVNDIVDVLALNSPVVETL